MDTGQLKRFACQARVMLKQGVKNRLEALGFVEGGPLPEQPTRVQGATVYRGNVIEDEGFYDRWMALNDRIRLKGIREVYEEAAYTWFNRLVAIAILTRNDLCEPVLSYEDDVTRVPHIVTSARRGRFPVMTESQRRSLMRLLDDDSKTFEQFNVLITAFCHNNPIIRACFGGITEYTEMLLPTNILAQGGFLDLLNHTDYITDDDFKSPELIGWLYQFYISERKDEVFAKKGKYTPDEIPAATQIFTPNWIVKYMVQNTVGRIYLDNNPSDADELKPRWKYLVDCEQQGEKLEVNDLTELKVADLACGSGHILNECFDLLLELYINEGYSRRDAVESIFANNLTGVDIDTRAKQLATFALMLKACLVDDSFTDAHTLPRVLDMPQRLPQTVIAMGPFNNDPYEDTDAFVEEYYAYLDGAIREYFVTIDKERLLEVREAMNVFGDCDLLGSIMKFDISDSTRFAMDKITNEWKQQASSDQALPANVKRLMPYFEMMLALTEKYSALIMNPPYMGSGGMDERLSKYVKDNYEEGKADLSTVFMLLQAERTEKNGFYGFITPPSWMFLSTFENLRRNIIDKQSICSLLHLSRGIFGADFGSVSAIIKNQQNLDAKGTYFRLIERTFQEFFEADLRKLFESTLKNHDFKYDFGVYNKDSREIYSSPDGKRIYYPDILQANFEKIPGSPIGYWVSERIQNLFINETLDDYAFSDGKNVTGDNERFLRLLWEVSSERIGKDKKWMLQTKGGEARKWYGNTINVIAWSKKDIEFYHKNKVSRVIKEYLWYKEGITWSKICSSRPTFRFLRSDSTYDEVNITPNDEKYMFSMIGLLNTKIVRYLLDIINPTFSVQTENVLRMPFNKDLFIDDIVKECIAISREDWDAHETSWDFKENELLRTLKEETELSGDQKALHLIDVLLEYYKNHWEECFERLHDNEEELNRQFIDIYGLQDELTPDVPLDEVTILQQDEISIENDKIVWHDDVLMKQLISYAVGCMMGRYSIDRPGLILANQGDGMKEYEALVPDSRFEVDDDGIVPLMPRDCPFADNAVNRFAEFIRILMGEATQTENLSYVDQCLGKPLENYLVKDFWKDHKKMYQKRPIYWLFSSKKGAFQVIAYMHRMTPYTVEHIRVNYLLRHIDYLSTEIEAMQSRSATLNTAERRRLDKLIKDHQECLEYEERLHYVADKMISMDLDDGVVVNYAKFGDVLAKLN